MSRKNYFIGEPFIIQYPLKDKLFTIGLILVFLAPIAFFLYLILKYGIQISSQDSILSIILVLGFFFVFLAPMLFFAKAFQCYLVMKIKVDEDEDRISFSKTFRTDIIKFLDIIDWGFIYSHSGRWGSPLLSFLGKDGNKYFYPWPGTATDKKILISILTNKINKPPLETRTIGKWVLKSGWFWPLTF